MKVDMRHMASRGGFEAAARTSTENSRPRSCIGGVWMESTTVEVERRSDDALSRLPTIDATRQIWFLTGRLRR